MAAALLVRDGAFIQPGCWQTVPRGKTGTAPTGGGLGQLYPSGMLWGHWQSSAGRIRSRHAHNTEPQPSHPDPGRMVIVARRGLLIGWPRSVSCGRAVARAVTALPHHGNEHVSSMDCPAAFQPIPTNDRMRP